MPVGLLKKAAPIQTLFPYHHLVSDEDVLHVKHLYRFKNIAQFTTDLDYLLKYYKPIEVKDVCDAVAHNQPLPANGFLLTFDDGFREAYDIIAPILKRKGVPAIFFLNPAFLDNRELFYRCKISLLIDQLIKMQQKAGLLQDVCITLGLTKNGSLQQATNELKKINDKTDSTLDLLAEKLDVSFENYLKKEQPFLSSNQVRELMDMGFSVGGHSWDHPYYKLLSEDKQIEQTIQSMAFVRDELQAPNRLFSFPHSDADISQSFFDRIKDRPDSIDVYFGIQNQKEEGWNKMIQRFNAERPDVPMRWQLHGMLMLSFLQKSMGKHKVVRSNKVIG